MVREDSIKESVERVEGKCTRMCSKGIDPASSMVRVPSIDINVGILLPLLKVILSW
jgi:hypothetical protein